MQNRGAVNLAAAEGVEAQTLAYASETLPGLVVPIRPLPFRYESTGAETCFTNGLEPDAAARRVFSFHRPATLRQWLSSRSTLKGRMREAQALNRAGMWPAQIRAVENLEASVRDGRRRMLIQMATGGGKMFTAISALYRLTSSAAISAFYRSAISQATTLRLQTSTTR